MYYSARVLSQLEVFFGGLAGLGAVLVGFGGPEGLLGGHIALFFVFDVDHLEGFGGADKERVVGLAAGHYFLLELVHGEGFEAVDEDQTVYLHLGIVDLIAPGVDGLNFLENGVPEHPFPEFLLQP